MGNALRLTKYRRRFITLFKHPLFWTLTILGNGTTVVGAILLYIFEGHTQTHPLEFIDCLLWSMGIITTIGYSDYMAETIQGKITLLVLMMSGTLFVWSYMGFLVAGLLAPEIAILEDEVREIEKDLKLTRKNVVK